MDFKLITAISMSIWIQMKMMPIMSKKFQENKGTDHAQNGSREKRGYKSRSDKQRRENIGKVRKGEKEKRNLAFWKLESLKYQLNTPKFTIPIVYKFTTLAVIFVENLKRWKS